MLVAIIVLSIVLLLAGVIVGKPLFIWLDSRKAESEEGIGEVVDTFHVLQAPGTTPGGEPSVYGTSVVYNPQLDSYGCWVILEDGYVGEVPMSMAAWEKTKIGTKLKVTFRRCRHVQRIHVIGYSE